MQCSGAHSNPSKKSLYSIPPDSFEAGIYMSSRQARQQMDRHVPEQAGEDNYI